MDHMIGQATQPTQCGGPVQIAQQRRATSRPQGCHFVGAARQSQHAQAASALAQQGQHTQAHVTATHDQGAALAESGGQGSVHVNRALGC
jgi:hypothetical protein